MIHPTRERPRGRRRDLCLAATLGAGVGALPWLSLAVASLALALGCALDSGRRLAQDIGPAIERIDLHYRRYVEADAALVTSGLRLARLAPLDAVRDRLAEELAE